MDELLRLTLLYDFYGELLTQKQKQVYELYYQNDLSLSEIGVELSTSRQAVRDLLLRTEKILVGYEDKLHLMERFMLQKKEVLQIKTILDELGAKTETKSVLDSLERAKQIADEILS